MFYYKKISIYWKCLFFCWILLKISGVCLLSDLSMSNIIVMNFLIFFFYECTMRFFFYFFFFFLIIFFFFFFFFFNNSLFYLFIFDCVGSLLLCEGFLQLRQAGATLHRGARASHYRGLSCCGAQAPDAQAQ